MAPIQESSRNPTVPAIEAWTQRKMVVLVDELKNGQVVYSYDFLICRLEPVRLEIVAFSYVENFPLSICTWSTIFAFVLILLAVGMRTQRTRVIKIDELMLRSRYVASSVFSSSPLSTLELLVE